MSTEFAKTLRKSSNLTETQLETLVLDNRVSRKEISVKEASELRNPRPVSLGTYYRVRNQAKIKARRSLMTVVLLSSLGLLDLDELQRLVNLLVRDYGKVDLGTLRGLAELVQEIVNKIVMI